MLRRNRDKKVERIEPEKAKRAYTNTRDYKHFWGHVVREVAEQLPNKPVICWKDDHILNLPVCALNKFLKEKSYCKRCSLFQEDEHATLLREIIQDWEKEDTLEEEDGS